MNDAANSLNHTDDAPGVEYIEATKYMDSLHAWCAANLEALAVYVRTE